MLKDNSCHDNNLAFMWEVDLQLTSAESSFLYPVVTPKDFLLRWFCEHHLLVVLPKADEGVSRDHRVQLTLRDRAAVQRFFVSVDLIGTTDKLKLNMERREHKMVYVLAVLGKRPAYSNTGVMAYLVLDLGWLLCIAAPSVRSASREKKRLA